MRRSLAPSRRAGAGKVVSCSSARHGPDDREHLTAHHAQRLVRLVAGRRARPRRSARRSRRRSACGGSGHGRGIEPERHVRRSGVVRHRTAASSGSGTGACARRSVATRTERTVSAGPGSPAGARRTTSAGAGTGARRSPASGGGTTARARRNPAPRGGTTARARRNPASNGRTTARERRNPAPNGKTTARARRTFSSAGERRRTRSRRSHEQRSASRTGHRHRVVGEHLRTGARRSVVRNASADRATPGSWSHHGRGRCRCPRAGTSHQRGSLVGAADRDCASSDGQPRPRDHPSSAPRADGECGERLARCRDRRGACKRSRRLRGAVLDDSRQQRTRRPAARRLP